MNLQTAIEGVGQGLTEPILGMNHLTFCLMAALMLFTLRKKPADAWYYLVALIPGYALEWVQPTPPILVNVLVVASLIVVLLQQWIYEKLAIWTIPLLLVSGILHGLSLGRVAEGSSLSGYVAYTAVATAVQGLVIYGFGLLCRRLAAKSPDGFEGIENILSALGVGVAMTYLIRAF